MPAADSFPYTVRLVSDIQESNGSTSMATVCGCSLALLDAGVPIRTPVTASGVGLISEGDEWERGGLGDGNDHEPIYAG